ncbi:MAG: HAMP domain-containing protein [Rhodocyclaceae bacterium]|nr:HAMP domain-containing protein [Rhodocyclaceae bacterium]
MISALRSALRLSIRARLIAMTSITVVGVVCLLTLVIAFTAARILQQESSRQQSQSLEQSAALLSNFLDVRETNLSLWAANPLVEAVFKDPALASVFIPSLRSYFAQARAQEPWIAHIFLLQDKAVLYDDSDGFKFSDGAAGSQDGVAALTALPATGISLINLRQLNPTLDQPVVHLKRPLVIDGTAVPGAFVVLLLDFEQIDRRLFGQIQIGRHGFVSAIGTSISGELIVPSRAIADSPERSDFLASTRGWTSAADAPENYRSVALKSTPLFLRPFSIVSVASLNDVREPVLRLIFFASACGLVALLAGIWSAVFFSARLVNPILALTVKSEQLAHDNAHVEGDASVQPLETNAERPEALSNDATETASQDELGRLAKSFDRMQEAIRQKISVIEAQNEQLRISDQLKAELNQTLERRVTERTQQLQTSLEAQQHISEELERQSVSLVESNHNLEATLIDLRQTQDMLVQAEKLASLGSLVAGVAHELNTPIGVALTTASTLEDSSREFAQVVAAGGVKRTALDEFLKYSADMGALLVRSCHRAANLVASFKQVAVDQTSEQQRSFDLQALVKDIVASLRPSFSTAAWHIEVDVPAGILCDSYPGPLGQVLTNLIQNAGNHAFAGNAAGALRITASRTADTVNLVVADDGKGMNAETLSHIFDPFFTTTLGKGGSGLGLAICRNIVMGVLGGQLTATSQPGVGSQFVVRFPTTAPHPVKPAGKS